MKRERVMLEVHIDLDDVPGVFDCEEDFRRVIEVHLKRMFPWYNPEVKIPEKKDGA